jgi:hypothetical protein
MKCNKEKPSHIFSVPLGQAGVWTVCECLVKKNPRLLGGGPGGAGSPLEPGKPKMVELNKLKLLYFYLQLKDIRK